MKVNAVLCQRGLQKTDLFSMQNEEDEVKYPFISFDASRDSIPLKKSEI